MSKKWNVKCACGYHKRYASEWMADCAAIHHIADNLCGMADDFKVKVWVNEPCLTGEEREAEGAISHC